MMSSRKERIEACAAKTGLSVEQATAAFRYIDGLDDDVLVEMRRVIALLDEGAKQAGCSVKEYREQFFRGLDKIKAGNA
jgi:hypothetical protein